MTRNQPTLPYPTLGPQNHFNLKVVRYSVIQSIYADEKDITNMVLVTCKDKVTTSQVTIFHLTWNWLPRQFTGGCILPVAFHSGHGIRFESHSNCPQLGRLWKWPAQNPRCLPDIRRFDQNLSLVKLWLAEIYSK